MLGAEGTAAEAALNAAPDAIILMDAEGRVRAWNRAAERLFGYAAADTLGLELAELIIPGPLRSSHRHGLQRYVETGEGTLLGGRVELQGVAHDGTEIPLELSVVDLGAGAPTRFAGFIRPLAADEGRRQETARLQQRMSFLAEAGFVLDRSLELEETLRRLADLTVPELAQLTVIDLISDAGEIRTAVAAALDGAHARELEHVRARHPLGPGSPHPVVAAIRSRRSALLASMSDGFQRQIAQGDEHYELMRRLRYHSAIVVPLLGRERVFGVLSLLRMEGVSEYDGEDLVLAEELGRRAALAIENASLFEATRQLAVTLQRSLLPQRLPEVPELELVARYHAAADAQEVGGDFYDVFRCESGGWGLAVGDVLGKGPSAAALTAMARWTIRAVAGTGAAQTLGLLNEAVVRGADALPERFLTAVVAVANRDGEGVRIELAAAGHPPPLVLRASGQVEPTRVEGAMIGVNPGSCYEAAQLLLAPGDTLVLFTDGLTDARAPQHVLSEAELAALLVQGRGLELDGLAEALLASAIDPGAARDDIALLLARVRARTGAAAEPLDR